MARHLKTRTAIELCCNTPLAGLNTDAFEDGMTMTPDHGTPAIPTTSGGVVVRKIVAHTLAVVGVVMVLLGLVHFGGLPLILEANSSDAINLPSIEKKGMGFHLVRG